MDTKLALLLTWLTLVHAAQIEDTIKYGQSSIEITPINTENGYIILKNDEKLMINKYFKVLHIFKTTEVEQSLESIRQAIDLLKNGEHTNILDMIKIEFNTLTQSLKTLTPYRRQKRGLINLVGKVNKFIWGTMDNDDAEEIYDHLNNLDKNVQNVVSASNEQVTINNKLFQAVTDMKNHLNNQTKSIERFLDNIGLTTNKIAKHEDRTEKLLELYLVVHKTNSAIEKFSDVILMSRLNLLAHDIFSESEILKYNVTIENLPFIKTNVIFEKNQLIFVLKIPQLIKQEYYEAIVIPFPNSKNLELDTKITKILINNKEIFENTEEPVKESKFKDI